MAVPALKQTPSTNYSPTPIAHDLVIVHLMEGGYAGSVAWLSALTGSVNRLAAPVVGNQCR